jgi:hypothetical protein
MAWFYESTLSYGVHYSCALFEVNLWSLGNPGSCWQKKTLLVWMITFSSIFVLRLSFILIKYWNSPYVLSGESC